MFYAVYVIFAMVFFFLQLIFCLRAKRTVIRLIPLYFIAAGYLFALFSAEGYFGGGTGFIDDGALAGAIIAVGVSCAAVCDALAWGAFLLVYKRKKKQTINIKELDCGK